MKVPNLKAIPPRQYVVAGPMILSFVSFILCLLAICAGQQRGLMEDYAIVRISTSMIARSAVGTGAQGKLGALVNSLGAVGDVTGKMGISDWYSIHVTNSCEGEYKTVDGTPSSHQLVVKKCSSSSPKYRFNLTHSLDHELSIGPLRISLAQLNFPPSIQDKIDAINDVLYTLLVLYILTLTSALLAVPAALCPTGLLPLPPFLLLHPYNPFFTTSTSTSASKPAPITTTKPTPTPTPKRRRTALVLLNMGIASFSAFCAFLAGTLVTAASAIGASAINDAGGSWGLAAQQGIKIIVLSWLVTGLMGLVVVYWGVELLLGYLERRRERRRMMMEAKLPY